MSDETPTLGGEHDPVAPQPPGAARKTIRDVVNAELSAPAVRRLVKDLLAMKGFQWGYCTTCKSKVQVEVRDVAKSVTALKDLLTEAEGRPAGPEEGGSKLIVCRPVYGSSLGDAVAELRGIAVTADSATRERLDAWLEQWAAPATSGA
jgi:hypothetical protein